MDLAARPYITAGIALTSAAVVAAGPMAQHLPGLHLAQQLRTVSVSGIQLTDAASSVIDLFAGVENQLASLAGGVSATAVPAAALTDDFSPIAQNLIVQTWANTFTHAGANLQYIYNVWSKLPASVLQQVLANWINYGNIYVESYQSAAADAINYFGAGGSFWGELLNASNALTSGNISGAVTDTYDAFYAFVIPQILYPLETIIEKIPVGITKNLSNATSYLTSTVLSSVGLLGILGIPAQTETALGTSLQAAYNAYTSGNLLGAVTNLLNTPGAMLNGFLNGASGTAGLLSSPAFGGNGLVWAWVNSLGPGLAKQIVASGATNIVTAKGNVGFAALQTAFQGFVNNLVNGWPSLSPIVSQISGSLTSLLQNIPSVLSNLPSILSNTGTWLASNIGFFISSLLKLL
ncbi:hypothetical protein H7H82_00170 [Mycobacterium heidelbergense]|nr:hypothetical protein [Mycobacterium heidelbergense]MCV7049036.1 hypothetical protein [Mycobacterium heidelbergense]BBZ50368.1 hypothetical protein MHEI_20850 [Mycobacterium heidelbergense]